MSAVRKKSFTLLETVVAVAVLVVSLGVLFQMAASARKRIAQSAEDWHTTHRLLEAAEYALLHGDGVETVPERFFPYEDCRAVITWEEMDDVHEQYTMNSIAGQPELQACTIQLYRLSDGKELDRLVVDRILYDNALIESEN